MRPVCPHRLILAGLFLLLMAPAGAEEGRVLIRRKNGSTVEGDVVKSTAAWVQIRTRFGIVQVHRADILTMSEGVSLQTEFKKLRSALADTDAPGLLKLAEWCKEKKLIAEASACYQEASEIAGPTYIRSRMLLAELSMATKDYRLAVLAYQDLAERLDHRKAFEALQKAEDLLRAGRLKYYRDACTAQKKAKYRDAIRACKQAFARTVLDKTELEGDISRAAIARKLFDCREMYMDAMRERGCRPDLIAEDRPRRAWVHRPRPADLRRRAGDVTFGDLRIDLDRYAGRWLAVKGRYFPRAKWSAPGLKTIRLAEKPHPEVAVVAYMSKAPHSELLEQYGKDGYLEELLADYPYRVLGNELTTVTPGGELVCYGRLRYRTQFVPQYVLEVWAIEAVSDPQAATLATHLKKPLRCQFTDTPLPAVLEFIDLVTQTKVKFEDGKIPEISITISVTDKPTGHVIGAVSRAAGLKWTRRGEHVLMKKDLTEREEALRAQIIRLATDKASR